MQNERRTILMSRPVARASRACAALSLAGILLGCGTKSDAPPQKDAPSDMAPTAPAAASAPAPPTGSAPAPATGSAPSATAIVNLPKPAIPMLTPVELKLAGSTEGDRLYLIEGALILTRGDKVGRVVTDGVLWIGNVPSFSFDGPPVQTSIITMVKGRWPDSVDVVYIGAPGRQGRASYLPLTGKGKEHDMSAGVGQIANVITMKESRVLVTQGTSGLGSFGYEFVTVRGPEIALPGKADDDSGGNAGSSPGFPSGSIQFNASRAGTLIGVGRFGSGDAPAAWVWSGPGKSRIIDLSQWLNAQELENAVLNMEPGAGDELWIYSAPERPILRYKDGAFEQVPALDRPVKKVFVSMAGQLHASDGRVIYRFDEGRWKAVAELPWPMYVSFIHNGVFRSGLDSLRENGGMEPRDDCATPFVYLDDVEDRALNTSTFPETRKALLSFPDLSGLNLVEFKYKQQRKLGIQVSSNAQGLAVIAHVKDALKGADPRLLCFNPPDPRVIDVKTGTK